MFASRRLRWLLLLTLAVPAAFAVFDGGLDLVFRWSFRPEVKSMTAWALELEQTAAADRRVVAAEKLFGFGLAAVPVLEKCLRSESAAVREVAAVSLARIAVTHPPTVAIVLANLDHIPASREAVLELLREGTSITNRATYVAPSAGADQRAIASAVAVLSQATQAADVRIRGIAIHTLAQLGGAGELSLVKLLDAPEVAVRRQAIVALATRSPILSAVSPHLTKALSDEDVVVRLWATRALASCRVVEDSWIVPLSRNLVDSDADLRWQSLTTLHDLGLARRLPPAIWSRLVDDINVTVRRRAIAIQAAIGS